MKFILILIFLLSLLVVTCVASNLKVLTVYVGEYKDSRLPALPYALDDVVLFEDAIIDRGMVDEEDITLLENLTLAGLASGIKKFFQSSGDKDRIMIYYNGFVSTKGGKLRLAPLDEDPDCIEETTYDLIEEIERILNQMGKRDVMIIISAFYNDFLVDQKFWSDTTKKSLEQFVKKNGLILLISCEKVSEERSWSEHRFTHYLVEGLRGEAGKEGKEHIYVSDLFEYVNGKMKEKSSETEAVLIITDRDVALTRNPKQLYQYLLTEITKHSIAGKIEKDLTQIYFKIILQEANKDNEVESEIRSFLIRFANDENVDLLVSKTKNLLTQGGDKAYPVRPRSKGSCELKVIAANELAKTGTLYINGKRAGTLGEGTLVIKNMNLGKYRVVVDGQRINRWEREIEFKFERETHEIFVQCETATRQISITTEPDGADVWLNGKKVGTTPGPAR